MIIGAILIPLTHGFTVSAAVMIFLSILNIAPHLAGVTQTQRYIRLYGWTLCGGTLFFGFLSLLMPTLVKGRLGEILFTIIAFLDGMFTGVLLAALAEVFDIFPSITGKLKIKKAVKVMIVALALGKVTGSLIYWLTPWFMQ